MMKHIFLFRPIVCFAAMLAISSAYAENGITYIIMDGKAYISGEKDADVVLPTEIPAEIEKNGVMYPVVGIYARDYSYPIANRSESYPASFSLPGSISFPSTIKEYVYRHYVADYHTTDERETIYTLEDFLSGKAGNVENPTDLTIVNVAEGGEYYGSYEGVLYNADRTELKMVPRGRLNVSEVAPETVKISAEAAANGALTAINLNNKIQNIGNRAFAGCHITEFTIPASTRTIGEDILANNPLATLTIDEGCAKIGAKCFRNLTELKTLTLPESLTYIGEEAFAGCSGLTQFKFPTGVISARSNVLADCTSLESVILSDKTTFIRSNAFANCTSLTSLHIPATVKQIDAGATAGCTSLTQYTVADGSEYYASADGILYSAGLETLVLAPAGVVNLNLPDETRNVSSMAFKDNATLQIINLNKATSIQPEAFSGCRSLHQISFDADFIAESTASIGKSAFYDCPQLTEITIPARFTLLGAEAFGLSYDLVLELREKCPARTVVFPEGIKFLPVGACRNNYLENVSFPTSLTEICQSAFDGAKWAENSNILLPDGLLTIDESAFGYGNGAWLDWQNNIKSLYLPQSLESIDEMAFAGLKPETIEYPAMKPVIATGGIFSSACYKGSTLIVPEYYVDVFKQRAPWINFMNITGKHYSGVETVGADSNRISISGGVITIGEGDEAEVYTLAGQRIWSGRSGTLTPGKGVYIIRTSSSSAKVIL